MSKKFLVFSVCFFLVASFVFADYITITPAAFDDNDDDANAKDSDLYGTYFYDTGGVWFLAPVHLPDGVILRNMRLHYLDNNSGNLMDIFCNFIRINKYTGGRDYIFQTSTGGSTSSSIRSIVDNTCPTAAWRQVRNNSCNYYILLGFGAAGTSLRVYGVTIEY